MKPLINKLSQNSFLVLCILLLMLALPISAQNTTDAPNSSADTITDEEFNKLLNDQIRLSDDRSTIFWNLQTVSTVPATSDSGGDYSYSSSGSGDFSLDFSNLDLADLAEFQVVDSINTVIIKMKTTERADLLKVLEVINTLDQPRKQILIKVLIAEMEVLKNRFHHSTINAMDASVAGSHGVAATAEINQDNADIQQKNLNEPGFDLYLLNNKNMKMFLSAQKTNHSFNVISAPHVVGRHGEKSTVIIGQKINVVSSETQVSGQNDQIIKYDDESIGLEFMVTPYIYANNQVGMEIIHKLSQVQKIDMDMKTTETSHREMNTFANVKSGQTVVLAGMFQRRKARQKSRVPGMERIPLIGKLFERSNRDERDVELMIFITPTIISDSDAGHALLNADTDTISAGKSGTFLSDRSKTSKGKRRH